MTTRQKQHFVSPATSLPVVTPLTAAVADLQRNAEFERHGEISYYMTCDHPIEKPTNIQVRVTTHDEQPVNTDKHKKKIWELERKWMPSLAGFMFVFSIAALYNGFAFWVWYAYRLVSSDLRDQGILLFLVALALPGLVMIWELVLMVFNSTFLTLTMHASHNEVKHKLLNLEHRPFGGCLTCFRQPTLAIEAQEIQDIVCKRVKRRTVSYGHNNRNHVQIKVLYSIHYRKITEQGYLVEEIILQDIFEMEQALFIRQELQRALGLRSSSSLSSPPIPTYV